MKLFIVLLAFVSVVVAQKFPDCKCHEGFEAKQDSTGKVACYGILLRIIRPCNTPQRPRCKCGPEVTGIVTDASGTWCATYRAGKETKRWACENTAEWEEYHRQHPK